MNAVRQMIGRIRKTGVRRKVAVTAVVLGRARTFEAFDLGEDTFIVQRDILAHLDERPSVLLAEKMDLKRRTRGRVMTISTGNHAVAAFPLLDGRFWNLSNVPVTRRSEVLVQRIVVGNAVAGKIELSQRESSTERLAAVDAWLRAAAHLGLGDVIMSERNADTLEYFRRLGQEWRVKPLAWTETEIRVALAACRKRIGTTLYYYHSPRGVHFLGYAAFHALCALAREDAASFVQGLRELVGVYEGNACSFARMPKYRGHHEIEFFGLRRGLAEERLVPTLERLLEDVTLSRLDTETLVQRADEAARLFMSLLARPTLADETARDFAETLYMYVTGEIYAVVGEGSTHAFDDRRTALPGATFLAGRPVMHAGADARTEVLMSNLRGLMSKDEQIEYANVYELRTDDGDDAPLGRGATREIVYKTDRRPLENSLVEKRLSHAGSAYTGYLLARIGALRALGLGLSDFYMILRRRPGKASHPIDYYIRRRCEGEPLAAIPENYYRSASDASAEEESFVLALVALMGDAAAQNMAMKKYDARSHSPLFGIGKEIYEFEYDLNHERIVPKRVTTCSVRGSFGWPCLDSTDENVAAIASFYMQAYARALVAFARQHHVALSALAARFFEGFEHRTHAMAWQLAVMRDKFESFVPDVVSRFNFRNKWRFVMWSLERQERRMASLRQVFMEKLETMEHEEIRNNPQ